ncbi:uncharacterized protein SPSK_10389 [Sporothrix schenckii 1099-18]|uniref:Nephrocystin 3-like N-terminal domain-containing protein n=1 Tax=Sporothrix schenckii 1099-18 TaxID=1397361 RepID=A0A0F2MC52_SPOSC|nr:uncharacterized protein SPSK_10389 [Sporothrix schenckii 1099-18]KJR87283.1 hypothetical protein SPSK_10389 [Sporothrix schenckii 1099-18]
MARDATDIRSRKTLMLAFYFPGIDKREDEVSEAHTKTFLWIFDGYSTDDHNEVISSATDTTRDKEKIEVEHIETGKAINNADAEGGHPSNSKSTALRSTKVDKPGSNSKWKVKVEIKYPKFEFDTPLIQLQGPSDTSDSEEGDEDTTLPANTFQGSPSRDAEQSWYEDLPPVKNTGFVPWLRSGSGIYWISGKPGGGKSALVKFVYSHAVTAEALAEWKGTADYLVTTCHHFWSAGFDLQKSEEGLLRSILFQIAASFPSIVASVCSERDIGLRGDRGMSWTIGELWDILTRVIKCPETMQISVKFALFIDGLDEYDGDQDEILRRLKSFAALPHTKICAASREWSVFYRHFMSDDVVPVLQIKVHEYTYRDIYRYSKDKLDGKHQPARFAPTVAERQVLIREVVDRAQGVFLWVNLTLVKENGVGHSKTLGILVLAFRPVK